MSLPASFAGVGDATHHTSNAVRRGEKSSTWLLLSNAPIVERFRLRMDAQFVSFVNSNVHFGTHSVFAVRAEHDTFPSVTSPGRATTARHWDGRTSRTACDVGWALRVLALLVLSRATLRRACLSSPGGSPSDPLGSSSPSTTWWTCRSPRPHRGLDARGQRHVHSDDCPWRRAPVARWFRRQLHRARPRRSTVAQLRRMVFARRVPDGTRLWTLTDIALRVVVDEDPPPAS